MQKYSRPAFFAAGLIAIASLSACSDDPTSNDQVSVVMQTQLESSTAMLAKSTAVSANEVDSIRVNKMRLFVRRMKLQPDKDDTTNDKDVKTEPFVITFQGSAVTFANLTVPPGTYHKVKFEFHRAESSQIGEYLNNTDFADFVTDGRWSVIYDLTLYKSGVAIPAIYRSDVTANLKLDFDAPVALDAGTVATIALTINPVDVFRDTGKILDPRDEQNESKIDNNIKTAIKLKKK